MIEAVASLVIISIVLMACGSVIVLAARAMNNSTSGSGAQAFAARSAADQVTADLKVATSFTERTATAVTFTVPDRNGDGQPETIRYAWSGSSGSSVSVNGTAYTIAANTLTRQFNGGPPVAVADNVQAFGFNYILRTIGQPAQSPPAEGSVVTLASHNGAVTLTLAEKNNNWPAEYIRPTTTNEVSWKLTKVSVQMARASSTATGIVTLEARIADSAKKPTTLTLGTASVDVSTLTTTKAWVDFVFATPVSGISPTDGVCLVLSTTASNPATIYYDAASTDATIAYCTSGDSGGTWSAPGTLSAMQFTAYGTFTTQSPPPAAVSEPRPTYQ